MQPLTVILLQSDPGINQSLTVPLRKMFHSVRQASSLEDLRASIARRRPEVVILDLEMTSFSQLKGLSNDFPGVRFVCNHRLADDGMWTATLEAGAADCCTSMDTRGILRAASITPSANRMAA